MGLKACDKQANAVAASTPIKETAVAPSPNISFSDLKQSPVNCKEVSPKYNTSSSFHASPAGNSLNRSNFNSPYHNHSVFKKTPNGSFDASFMSTSAGSPVLRHRKLFTNSPLPREDYMTEQSVLESYLVNYEKENSKIKQANEKAYAMSWNVSYNALDYSTELADNIYQLSTLSPKSPTRTKENKDDSARQAVDEYWSKYSITHQHLNTSIARLRQYISVTVLRFFALEMDRINKKLDEIGCGDVKVGKSSLAELKIVQTKYLQRVPTLTCVLFFLELSTNQEYLVDRIRVLASGYMSAFKWNKEAKPKARESEVGQQELPNDCDIVMHALCVYIDLHLTLHPRHPDGKSFTSRYYNDCLKDADRKPESNLYMQRSKQNPPHYQVVYQGKLYDPLSGRHNFFQSVILFLHIIKTEYNSMIGPVCLGNKGLNILHVLDV